MAWQKVAADAAIVAGQALLNKAPDIIDHMSKRKEEKSFFVENKNWIFMIILSIFVTKLDYINMFKSMLLNSIVNIIYGIIILVLMLLFFNEVKDFFKVNSKFIKALIIVLITLSIFNFLYHVGYAISELLALTL